jgi:hypothetical protein
LTAEGRRALRQNDAVPLLSAFESWRTEQRRQALPESLIGQAIAYTTVELGGDLSPSRAR